MAADRHTNLGRSIERSDPFELAIALAALQLMPENADSLPVLESVSEFVASLPRRPRTNALRVSDVNALLRAFDMTCDPFEGMFTHSLVTPGVGASTVFCGRDPSAPFVQSALMAATFGGPAGLEGGFRRNALNYSRGILILSDEVARRAGVNRGARALHAPRRRVVIPIENRFRELRAAVRFTTAELRQVLGPDAVDLVLPFARAFGGPVPGEPLTGPLHHYPLLAGEAELIVALPGSLIAALTETLIALSGEKRSELAQRFRAAVREDAFDALQEIGLNGPWQTDAWDSADPVLSATTTLDRDCVLSVHVAVDGLDDFNAEGLDGSWDGAQATVDEMERRSLDVERHYSAAGPGEAPNAFLHLFVVQGVGRRYFMGLAEPAAPLRSPRLLLTGEELRAICVLEAREPLALLKFARAKEALHARTRVLAFGTLAQYQLYRRTEHSFYISDDRPTLVGIEDSLAEEARVAAHEKTDVHAAHLPGRRGFTVVRLLENDVRIPLYGLDRPDRNVVELLAELNVDCWVSTRIPKHESGIAFALSYTQLAVYWLWQLQPAAGQLYEAAARQGQVCVRLDLEVGPEFEGPTKTPPGEIVAQVEDGAVILRVPSSFTNALAESDNAGERAFTRALLMAVRAAAHARGHPKGPSDKTLDDWLEQHAPLGLKKKALHLNVGSNFELADEHLPPIRRLQDADFSDVLDELGEELRRRGMTIGPIEPEDRLAVLREAVDWAFTQMEREIAKLDPIGLVEWLVAHHESVLARQAQERLSTPTRLACYPMLDDLPRQISDERQRLVGTAMALRVVIEAVAARPPQGLRPMSLALHDRLLGLASEGINRALARDALQNRLVDDPMSILPSGRLGSKHDGKFYSGRTAYLKVVAQVEVEQARLHFARHWHPPATEKADAWEETAIDHAAKDEFGFTLSQLTLFCMEIAALGLNEFPSDVKHVPRDELVHNLEKLLAWSRADVERALELFVLRPREGLRTAPPGFEAADAYAWRMNRALSYLRRPLIERPSAKGPEILWGTRHLKDGNRYLLQLCQEGRLRARTPTMQKAIADLRHMETGAFNATVAERLSARGLIVQANVKKIGKSRLVRASGEDLGDIDVLAADRGRRIILAVETKDLGLARTPLEMGQQLRKIFVGGPGVRCDIDKHLERTEWLRQHLEEVLRSLGLSDEDASLWTVEPLLVTDEPLMTPYVVTTNVPVVAFRDLGENGTFVGEARRRRKTKRQSPLRAR